MPAPSARADSGKGLGGTGISLGYAGAVVSSPRQPTRSQRRQIVREEAVTLCSATLFLALHAAAAPPWAPGGPSRGEDLVISLATIGPGDEVASMGGHAALAVVDTRLEQGRLYNFGVVEFSPDLML